MKNITCKTAQTQQKVTRRPLRRAVALLAALAITGATALPVFAEDNAPICGLTAHTHDDACYTAQLVCGLEETAPVEGAETAGHLHTDACYALTLCCTTAEHTHDDTCYTAAAPEPVEPAETETAETVETEEVEVAETVETEEVEIAEGTEPEEDEAVETVETAGTEESGETEEVETEVVEIDEDVTPLDIRTVKLYEDAQVRITAVYDDETLPADAEMVVTAITAESDPEAYAALLEQANAALDTDVADLPAVFYGITFFANGEEVEPTAPVDVKVEFLDKEMFEVDEEMTVLQMDENGAQALESDITVDVANNTAAFAA